MIGAGIDAQVTELATAERPLRQHALHRFLDNALWKLALEDRLRGAFLDAADVAGVMPVDLVLTLLAGENDLLTNGKIDAFMASPPRAQELRARGTGHVILNSELDRPWSQYFCCMLIGSDDFVRRSPIATKRVVRAMMRATDICAAKPDWVAQRLVDRGLMARYNYVRQGLEDVSYRAWRDYDAEDAVRFWALRERELGMIKSSPDKIIATGTDWRFLREVRKELGI